MRSDVNPRYGMRPQAILPNRRANSTLVMHDWAFPAIAWWSLQLFGCSDLARKLMAESHTESHYNFEGALFPYSSNFSKKRSMSFLCR